MMHRTSKIGVVLAVALLVAGLAAPAGAKKGGHPGPPSGGGLEVTVEPSGSAMWANSVGDKIPFDITVTNSSGGALAGPVDFNGELLGSFDLAKNDSWIATYLYTVVLDDLAGLPPSEQSQVTVGKVTATASAGEVSDSDDAVMTAYPVLPCVGTFDDEGFYATVTFGPNADYSECSFTPSTPAYWTFTTTLEKPKKGRGAQSPSATVRDGIPGNWCNYGDSIVGGKTVTDYVFLPDDGVCLHGGAGGDTFPVRNADTFYLATWAKNTVDAVPTSSP